MFQCIVFPDKMKLCFRRITVRLYSFTFSFQNSFYRVGIDVEGMCANVKIRSIVEFVYRKIRRNENNIHHYSRRLSEEFAALWKILSMPIHFLDEKKKYALGQIIRAVRFDLNYDPWLAEDFSTNNIKNCAEIPICSKMMLQFFSIRILKYVFIFSLCEIWTKRQFVL